MWVCIWRTMQKKSMTYCIAHIFCAYSCSAALMLVGFIARSYRVSRKWCHSTVLLLSFHLLLPVKHWLLSRECMNGSLMIRFWLTHSSSILAMSDDVATLLRDTSCNVGGEWVVKHVPIMYYMDAKKYVNLYFRFAFTTSPIQFLSRP